MLIHRSILLRALLLPTFAMGQDQIGQIPPKHIVGGEDAISGEFPFVAKIIYSGNQVGCTGTLIAPDKVLTAGHCVSGYSDISVGFGDTRTLEPRHQVIESVIHPDVDANYWENDIAILQLGTSLPIRPVRLLTLEEELQYAPSGSLGAAVGWGSTHPSGGGGTSTRILQKVIDIPIYTHEDCRRVLDELRSQGKKPGPPRIHEKILCAGEEGRATGRGDSGGPLLVQTPTGWAQVGVLSQVTRDPFPQTVVYMGQWTRTSYFVDWVFPTYYLNFAHSAVGGGWRTDLVLLNPLQREAEAVAEVFSANGMPRITGERVALSELGMTEWELPEGEEDVETGGVVVSSPAKLSGFLRFRHSGGAATSVQSAPVGDAFLVPVSSEADRTGLAVYNADDKDLTVVLKMGERALYKTIPAQGKIAGFVDEYFLGGSANTLIVQTDPIGGQITVLALELVGESLVTLPAVPVD